MINNHRFDIEHQMAEESPVAEHFNGEGHTQADKAVMVMDQI